MTINAKPAADQPTLKMRWTRPRSRPSAVQRVNEVRVSKGFWPKIRRTAARIPFAGQALSVWFAARDPQTPAAAKGLMLGALAYFVLPVDAIPDIFAVVGFTDDAAVFAALLATLGANIKARHKDQARDQAHEALDRLKADPD
jgi:uncharacterized membrane protein YkvA (DUF1232 family)